MRKYAMRIAWLPIAVKGLLVVAVAAGLYAMSSQVASAQGAWCEANCKALCTKIYGRAGARSCFAAIPCSNFSGRPCAPASVVNARYVTYCHNNRGQGTCR